MALNTSEPSKKSIEFLAVVLQVTTEILYSGHLPSERESASNSTPQSSFHCWKTWIVS